MSRDECGALPHTPPQTEAGRPFQGSPFSWFDRLSHNDYTEGYPNRSGAALNRAAPFSFTGLPLSAEVWVMAMRRDQYPDNWDEISLDLRANRAQWRCEWCGAEYGKPHPITGSRVVLSVAHLNHTPADCRPENLAVLCARCHLNYDRQHHTRNLKITVHRARPIRAGQMEMDL